VRLPGILSGAWFTSSYLCYKKKSQEAWHISATGHMHFDFHLAANLQGTVQVTKLVLIQMLPLLLPDSDLIIRLFMLLSRMGVTNI